jgi:molybdopterin molybdotransferase
MTAVPRVSVAEHLARVAALLTPLLARPIESVPLVEALGRRTAVAVSSPIALPPFRNSQMDGFAVRATDVVTDHPLPVVGTIPAAPTPRSVLPAGAAMRIMTGAPLPEGADAVIPVEESTVSSEDARETVRFTHSPRSGAFVREAGSDLARGGELVGAEVVMASRHIAALAAAGVSAVEVEARIRIAVITTGAELAAAGTELEYGQIYDANGPALAAAARAAGALVVRVERVGDDEGEFARVLAECSAEAELVVTAGGISQGDFEVVRAVLEPHGAWVGSLALQPGGPQATARFAGVPVLCFPGNPVSAQLSFELLLAPLLRASAGIPARAVEVRVLAADLRSPADRLQLVRARLLDDGRVEPVAGPGSHLVATMAAADRIVVVPAEVTELTAGHEVTAWVL